MRIVALVPGGIGDQVLFFPTLNALKAAYPQADIDVIVEPDSKGAYRVCQAVSSVIPFNFKARSSPADWANLLGILRDRYYDAVISLKGGSAMGLLLWLTGIPERISYDTSVGSRFLTKAIPLETEQYEAVMYHDLLQGLNITAPVPDLSIDVLRSDVDWAESERQRLGLDQGGYVLIHDGGAYQSVETTYPVEKWKAIIQDFQKRQPELPIVIVQGVEEDGFAEALTSVISGLKLVKPGDVGKLAAMIAGSSLMVCTHGAPMHLAVALQAYTVALFGPTDPTKVLPKSDKVIGIKSSTMKASDIAPDSVLKKIWGE